MPVNIEPVVTVTSTMWIIPASTNSGLGLCPSRQGLVLLIQILQLQVLLTRCLFHSRCLFPLDYNELFSVDSYLKPFNFSCNITDLSCALLRLRPFSPKKKAELFHLVGQSWSTQMLFVKLTIIIWAISHQDGVVYWERLHRGWQNFTTTCQPAINSHN